MVLFLGAVFATIFVSITKLAKQWEMVRVATRKHSFCWSSPKEEINTFMEASIYGVINGAFFGAGSGWHPILYFYSGIAFLVIWLVEHDG